MLRLITTVCACFWFATVAISQVDRWGAAWPNTDFSKTSIDFNEVLSGGPAKDGIPAILHPKFYSVADDHKLKDKEPVMTVELAGQVPRAYPIRYLMWHEIIDDVIGGVPVAVTFCPLCNSGIVFDRRLKDGRVLTFGVTGKLRNSDMIMYDHETESWWQQFQGVGIVGELTGVKLRKLPGWMESWADYKARNPTALVMRTPEFPRSYGQNPYAGYDSGRPFLYRGENPPYGIAPLARVVVVGNRAWPLERFRKTTDITEAGVRITWKAGTASALDRRVISKGRDVGAIRVRDAKSGKDIVHDVAFAFAFHAFNPNGKWMLGQ